jgi:hypothetical protein
MLANPAAITADPIVILQALPGRRTQPGGDAPVSCIDK